MEVALIVAGGSGTRMQSTIPKQFLEVAGRPILSHTISAFRAYSKTMKVILVLPEAHIPHWLSIDDQGGQVELVAGGDTRYQSVKNGLKKVSKNDLVAIHDGVRPLVSNALIARCFAEAGTLGNAIPAVKPKDSIRRKKGESTLSVDRDSFYLIQTPQTFQAKPILQAYNLPFRSHFTDDASVAEQAGVPIHLVEGEYDNIKITTADDLLVAEALLTKRS